MEWEVSWDSQDFFWKFVTDYAAIARPLAELTKTVNKPKLKVILATEPVVTAGTQVGDNSRHSISYLEKWKKKEIW